MSDIDFSDTIAHWEPLTRPRAKDLEDTRKQLHWAAQLASAVGTTLNPARPDDSHTNLEWSASARGLVSQASPGPVPLRGLLRFEQPTLELVRGGGDDPETLVAIDLDGRRFDDVLAELSRAASEALDRAVSLARPDHAMPAHRVAPASAGGGGEAFGGWERHALDELTRWYANGDRALREVAGQDPRSTPVRCWPHQFDIATLLVLEREDPAEDLAESTSAVTRSLGVGMTPGDGSYADAYWYVTVWPHPQTAERPELASGGIWHEQGWVGAVLTSTALRQPQAQRFTDFMRSALTACETLASSPP